MISLRKVALLMFCSFISCRLTFAATSSGSYGTAIGRQDFASRSSQNLDSAKVFPNPFNPRINTNGLTIDNLTPTAEIRIYTINGELVRQVEYDGAANRSAVWDGKNSAGSYVARGVYICLIKSPQGAKRLKIAVDK